ncbi:TetR family transcriptional regulator [Lentzea sp. NPDC092896]|uniref:TetR family transcriptional regulator n=1 Tax=Lentzea sp. NPDC092896 TaxID=3364127 RepID=UPI003819F45E
MRTRDPERKRQQLLEGALAEFAEHGIGGARVDRIATRAGVSAGLVYSFYENKEGLFEAVYDSIVEQTVTAIPIDADNLPEYAGGLYDAGLQHPEVMRFVAWYALERGDSGQAERPSVAKSMAAKTAAIEDAQRRGVVTGDRSAAELLALVLTVANMWQRLGEDVRGLVAETERRRVVVDTVRQLVTP